MLQGSVSEDITLQAGQELWGNRGGNMLALGDGPAIPIGGAPTAIDGVVTLPSTGSTRVRYVDFAGVDVGIRTSGPTDANVRIDYVNIVSESGHAFVFDGGGQGTLQIDGMTVDTSASTDALPALAITDSRTTFARGVLGGTFEVVGGGTGVAVSLQGSDLNSVIFDRVEHATGPALDVNDCEGTLTLRELAGHGQFPARIRNARAAMSVSLSDVDVVADQPGGTALELDTLLGTVLIDGLRAESQGASLAFHALQVPFLEVLGADNALLADGGDVAELSNTHIAVQGATFARVDNTQGTASGSCSTGLLLEFVGGAGAFVVDGGTGMDGGTLAGCTDGVSILNADDVRLALMELTGGTNGLSYSTSAPGSFDLRLDRLDVSGNTAFGVDASALGGGGGVADIDFEILSSNLDASDSTLNALLVRGTDANVTVRALVDGSTLAVDDSGLNVMRVAAEGGSSLDFTLRGSPAIFATNLQNVAVFDSNTTSAQCVSVSGNAFQDPDGPPAPQFFFNAGGTSTLSFAQLGANPADVTGMAAALNAANTGTVAVDTAAGNIVDTAACTLPSIPALP